MTEDLAVLQRALDQLAALVADVPAEAADDPTPCPDWRVRDLVDHVVAAPARFARMVRDEPIDWSAPTPPAGDDPAAAFRAAAEDLLDAWREQSGTGTDWQCAELAVHAWDLATALHAGTGALDPEVAERGLTFMQANLTSDNRAPAFGPPQPVPEGADAYARIAAFAGRTV